MIKNSKRLKRKLRIKKHLRRDSSKPRMVVFKSNKHLYVQIIDDTKGHTLVSASSIEKDFREKKASKGELAEQIGELIAKRAKEKGIEKIVFDRNGYKYHGNLKKIADSARKVGLVF